MVVGHRLASEVGEELTKPPRARGALKLGRCVPGDRGFVSRRIQRSWLARYRLTLTQQGASKVAGTRTNVTLAGTTMHEIFV